MFAIDQLGYPASYTFRSEQMLLKQTSFDLTSLMNQKMKICRFRLVYVDLFVIHL